MENYKLRFAQISDTHITNHRNLLTPMIDSINREGLDFVIVTGDLIHNNNDEDSFKIAASLLNNIKCRVFVLPGEYDGGALWAKTFGQQPKYLNMDEFCIEFVDTSFMKDKFSVGWIEYIEKESPEQYLWLKDRLSVGKWHFVFSHHPVVVNRRPSDEHITYVLLDNMRVNYCGHIHDPSNFVFTYIQNRGANLTHGIVCVPMKFHGNSCYNVVTINNKGEIAHTPRAISIKVTAW